MDAMVAVVVLPLAGSVGWRLFRPMAWGRWAPAVRRKGAPALCYPRTPYSMTSGRLYSMASMKTGAADCAVTFRQ